jgi:hypothetical protein
VRSALVMAACVGAAVLVSGSGRSGGGRRSCSCRCRSSASGSHTGSIAGGGWGHAKHAAAVPEAHSAVGPARRKHMPVYRKVQRVNHGPENNERKRECVCVCECVPAHESVCRALMRARWRTGGH